MFPAGSWVATAGAKIATATTPSSSNALRAPSGLRRAKRSSGRSRDAPPARWSASLKAGRGSVVVVERGKEDIRRAFCPAPGSAVADTGVDHAVQEVDQQ